MATFQRRELVSLVDGGYASYRSFVREDFRRCCAYCLLHEFWAGGERNFELDYLRPVSRFPHLLNDYQNLFYACHVCNQVKSDHWPRPALEAEGIGFVNLCDSDWEAHYRLSADGALEPLTASARYTITTLRLNSPHFVSFRAFLLRSGLRLDTGPPAEFDNQ